MFYINIIFIFYGLTRKLLNNLSIISQLLITVSLFFIPIFMIYAHNGYADMAVSYIFTTCIGLYMLSQNSKYSFHYQLLALIISSTGILIKNEAIPFFIIFNLAFIISCYRHPRGSLKATEGSHDSSDLKRGFFASLRMTKNFSKISGYIVLLLFLLIPAILWEIFKRKYHLAFYLDNATITSPILKMKTILFHFMDEFIRTSYYSLTSIIVLLILIAQTTYLSIKKRFSKLIPFVIVVLMFAAYGYVYLITTVPLETQLQSSFERLFMHLLPSMYLVVLYQFRSIFESLGE